MKTVDTNMKTQNQAMAKASLAKGKGGEDKETSSKKKSPVKVTGKRKAPPKAAAAAAAAPPHDDRDRELERKRHISRLSSQRLRMREKDQLGTLQKKQSELVMANSKMKAENASMTAQIQSAKQLLALKHNDASVAASSTSIAGPGATATRLYGRGAAALGLRTTQAGLLPASAAAPNTTPSTASTLQYSGSGSNLSHILANARAITYQGANAATTTANYAGPGSDFKGRPQQQQQLRARQVMASNDDTQKFLAAKAWTQHLEDQVLQAKRASPRRSSSSNNGTGQTMEESLLLRLAAEEASSSSSSLGGRSTSVASTTAPVSGISSHALLLELMQRQQKASSNSSSTAALGRLPSFSATTNHTRSLQEPTTAYQAAVAAMAANANQGDLNRASGSASNLSRLLSSTSSSQLTSETLSRRQEPTDLQAAIAAAMAKANNNADDRRNFAFPQSTSGFARSVQHRQQQQQSSASLAQVLLSAQHDQQRQANEARITQVLQQYQQQQQHCQQGQQSLLAQDHQKQRAQFALALALARHNNNGQEGQPAFGGV